MAPSYAVSNTPFPIEETLVDDPNSKVPVIAGAHGIRAILKGEGAGAPLLANLFDSPSAGAGPTPGAAASIRDGDDVMTSGDEGILPRGLKIGTVRLAGDSPRVVLAARRQGLEFVSLLFMIASSLNERF